ncbi:MAG TPA: VOC family protein [Oligoflexia bacterium]|nr:VOC family protein [Oligoflexia bacterium]
MSRTLQSVLVFFCYVAIILCVAVYSGRTGQKTLYDRYLIKPEGAIIQVADIERSVSFYNTVLDFPLADSRDSQTTRSFVLPGPRRLILEAVPARQSDTDNQTDSRNLPRSAAVLIRVRNGFEKLHKEYASRLGRPAQPITNTSYWDDMQPDSISEVFHGEWGIQFAVRDPDGNMIVFYRPRRLLFEKASSSK